MTSKSQEVRAELKQLSSSFFEEENVFSKSIIIYNFVEVIIQHKEAKKTFDHLMIKASEEISLAETDDEDTILKVKLGNANCFWRHFADLDFIHSLMKNIQSSKDVGLLNKLVEINVCAIYSLSILLV